MQKNYKIYLNNWSWLMSNSTDVIVILQFVPVYIHTRRTWSTEKFPLYSSTLYLSLPQTKTRRPLSSMISLLRNTSGRYPPSTRQRRRVINQKHGLFLRRMQFDKCNYTQTRFNGIKILNRFLSLLERVQHTPFLQQLLIGSSSKIQIKAIVNYLYTYCNLLFVVGS